MDDTKPPKDMPLSTGKIQTVTDQMSRISIVGKPRQFVYGDNFHQFCDRFIEYVTINELKKNLDMIFLSFVDNRTHASLKSVELDDEDKADAAKLCDAFKKAINPVVSNANALAKLYNLKQKSHESIDDYNYRLGIIAQKLNFSPSDLTSHKLEAFIQGLRNSAIKLEIVRDRKNLTYDKAVSSAKSLEAFFIEDNRNNSDDTEIKNIRGSSSSDRTSSRDRRSSREGAHRDTRGTSNYCSYCHKTGHDISNCFRKRKVRFSCKICGRSGHNERSCYQRENKRCKYCGKSNHDSRDCWSKNQVDEINDHNDHISDQYLTDHSYYSESSKENLN